MSQAPEFHLQRVNDDGSSEPREVYRLTDLNSNFQSSRRGFALTSLSIAGVFAATRDKLNAQPLGRPAKSIAAHSGFINDLGIGDGGRVLVSVASDALKFWSLPEGKLSGKKLFTTGKDRVNRLIITLDETHVVAGSESGAIDIWSLSGLKKVSTASTREDGVTCLQVTPDGRNVVAGTLSGALHVLSIPDGKLLATLRGRHSVICLATSPDGQHVVSESYYDKNVWSLPTRELVTSVDSDVGVCCAITPDGKYLVSGSGKADILVSSLPDLTRVSTLTGHKEFVSCLSITPDGKHAVSGSSDKSLKIWSLPEGRLIATMSGHTDEITCMAVTDDGKYVVSGSKDKTLRAWSLPDGRLVAVRYEHVSSLSRIVTKSRGLASADSSGTIILWTQPELALVGYLFDSNASQSDATTYKVLSAALGRELAYTVPYGSPIPAGAVCVCNCVPGNYRPSTVGSEGLSYPIGTLGSGKGTSGNSTGGTLCRCNKICTCIPVCQAHRLADADPRIARLAEALVTAMGPDAVPYLRWAERQGADAERERIVALRRRLQAGESVESSPWPSARICRRLLQHGDEVVAVMAAQMLALRRDKLGEALSPETSAGVESLLAAARARAWHLN